MNAQIKTEQLNEAHISPSELNDGLGNDINNGEQNMEAPYIEETIVTVVHKYNRKYGDERICTCGHIYYRHFDSYDDMNSIGCKYCECLEFTEDKHNVL